MMAGLKRIALAVALIAVIGVAGYFGWRWYDASRDVQAAKARSIVDQATANLAYERKQVAVLDANEAVAKAAVGSAEAALLTAKFALGDTEIWSPIAGIVANRKARVGEYVTAGTRLLS